MIKIAEMHQTTLRFQHLMFLDRKRIEEQKDFNKRYFNIESNTFLMGYSMVFKISM